MVSLRNGAFEDVYDDRCVCDSSLIVTGLQSCTRTVQYQRHPLGFLVNMNMLVRLRVRGSWRTSS